MHRHRTLLTSALLALAAMISLGAPAAQTPADPIYQAAKAGYDALPEAERIAVQDDLVWASTYRSVLDGNFGRGTFSAIVTHELRGKTPADGLLDPGERQSLGTMAAANRAAAGWTSVTPKAVEASLMVPKTLLPVEVAGKAGTTTWKSTDGTLALGVDRVAGDATLLPRLFAELKADAPGRKVIYSVQRADWFVVTFEKDGRRGYSRYVAQPGGALGFLFTYDLRRADGERLATAIANGFPKPNGGAPDVPAAPAATEVPAANGSVAPPATPAEAPKPAAVARPSTVVAISALAVGQGKALVTTAALQACQAPSIAGAPVSVAAQSGPLALIAAGSTASAVVMRHQAAKEDDGLIAFYRVPTQSGADLSLATGKLVPAGDDRLRFVAALAGGGGSAPLFDRAGALAGLVAGAPAGSDMTAETANAYVGADDIAAFLSAQGVTVGDAGAGAALSAGQLAGRVGPSILSIRCGR